MENTKEPVHFVKIIDYNQEPWLTDVIIGQKGSKTHAHITISGGELLYIRDGEGKEIIKKDF